MGQELKRVLAKSEKLEIELLKKETTLTDFLFDMKMHLILVKWLFLNLNIESRWKQSEINSEIDNLNTLKSSLRKSNEEWEDMKNKIIIFQNYYGKIKNSICINAQHKNDEKISCESFEKIQTKS